MDTTMEESPSSQDGLEMGQLVWRTRELMLRTRVLQSQLELTRRTKEATLEITKSINESIQSTDAEQNHRSKLAQKQYLQEKQNQLQNLNSKLSLAKSQILIRSKRMVLELWDIYPINEFPDRKGYSICDIHLPSSEHFEGHDETMISVAIGYVSHLISLLSEILDVALRFPLKYCGSKSLIYCNRKNQLFPLYIDSSKSREWANFSYGVNLLNLDIVQIRSLYGLPTTEPDETLANLHGLRLTLYGED